MSWLGPNVAAEKHITKSEVQKKKGMSSQSPGLTKKLVVKLTPVPVSPQPVSRTCLSIHPSPERRTINSEVTDGALEERETMVEIEKGMEMEEMTEREDVENCVNDEEEDGGGGGRRGPNWPQKCVFIRRE